MAADLIHVPLAPLDHALPFTYPKIALYMPLERNANPKTVFEQLQEGLRQTLIQQPWLGGKAYWQAKTASKWRPGQAEIRYKLLDQKAPPPNHLTFNNLETELSFDDLLEDGFPIDAFVSKDVIKPLPIVGDLETGADVLVAQANFFIGGCLLVMTTCHVIDGTSMVTALKLWADNCSRLQHGKADEKPPLPDTFAEDRTLFENLWRQEAPRQSLNEADSWTKDLLGIQSKLPIASSHQQRAAPLTSETMQNRLFYLSVDRLGDLKRECAVGAPEHPPSGNHALSALLWRTITMSIRSAGQVQLPNEAVLELLMDGRPEFSQSVPATFMGNVVFFHHTKLKIEELLASETTLARIAQAISFESRRIQQSSLQDCFSHLLAIPDFSLIRPKFYGDSDAVVLDIANDMFYPIDDVQFDIPGFKNKGRAEAVRSILEPVPVRGLIRVVIVLPRTRHGGIEVVLQLSAREMECVLEDEEFARFFLPM